MSTTMVTLVGNLCTQPELKTIPATNNMPETSVCTFRVACDRKIPTDQTDGRGRPIYDSTDVLYIGVECWGVLADNASSTLNVGSPVIISGKIVTSSWEDTVDEKKVRRSVIRCRAFHIGPNLAREGYIPRSKMIQLAEDTARGRLKEMLRLHSETAQQGQQSQQGQESQQQNNVNQEQVRVNPSSNAA